MPVLPRLDKNLPPESTEVRLIRAALEQLRSVEIPVRGSSMFPTIRPNTKVTVVKQAFSAVQVGQVVAISCGQRIIIHRVVDRAPQYLVTQGDNMPLLDPPSTPERYIGVVPGIGTEFASTCLRERRQVPHVKGTLVQHQTTPLSFVTLVTPEGAFLPADSATDKPVQFSFSDVNLCIGISPAGAQPISTLSDLFDLGMRSRRQVLVLLGFSFGIPNAKSDTVVLPPEVIDYSIRVGMPWQVIGLSASHEEVQAEIKRYELRSTP
jgi:hypothetical protein